MNTPVVAIAANANRATMRRRERALAARDAVMAQLIEAAGPCTMHARLERTPFESLASSIAHQQLNGAVAARILERFVALYAPAAFPDPAALLATDDAALRATGFSFAKIRALRDLAEKALTGVVPAAAELIVLEDAHIIERLTQVRGIGPWTVQMMLMFQLGRPDVLPIDDYGVRNGFRLAYGLKGLPTPRALAEFGKRWQPDCSMAAWYLWRAVDLSREGKLPRAPRPPRIAIQKPRAVEKQPKQKKPAPPGKGKNKGKGKDKDKSKPRAKTRRGARKPAARA
jgi:DNA-3-methyladenine glycosylase II